MNLITISEENISKNHQKDWYIFLSIQKLLVEEHFDWVKFHINTQDKLLIGKGVLNSGNKKYEIFILYSPFYNNRYDRIYINDKSIKYNKAIHLYSDLSLCLYHPTIDQPLFGKIPLFKMLPWISEWIVFYEQWKKYGVWLGKEIKH
ncbi:MAG: hypothetical protein ACT6QS_14935 [Flavobacteriales bacterium]